MRLRPLFFLPPRKVTRIADPRGAVLRSNLTLLEQRGWRAIGGGFEGPYAPKDRGTWRGRITRRGDVFEVLIHRPPREMASHPKWACFHTADREWFRIHLHTNPVDGRVDPIIAYVERLLIEALASTPLVRAFPAKESFRWDQAKGLSCLNAQMAN